MTKLLIIDKTSGCFLDIIYVRKIFNIDFYIRSKGLNLDKENIILYYITDKQEATLRQTWGTPDCQKVLDYKYDEYIHRMNFSLHDIKQIYFDVYINYNMKNLLKCNLFDYEFIPIDKLEIFNTNMVEYSLYPNDKFLQDYKEDMSALGWNILNHGTYFPCVVEKLNDDKYKVYQGIHRVSSLKLLNSMGKSPKDFKLFCLIMKKHMITFDNNNFNTSSIKFRYIFDVAYGCSSMSDEIRNYLRVDAKNNGDKFINDFIVERTCNDFNEIYSLFQDSAGLIRDLLFLQDKNYSLIPDIFNNQNAFNSWYQSI